MILYRTEAAYGSGVRNITEIIEHEIFELGNTDILDYLVKHYDYAFSSSFLDKMKRISNNSENINDYNEYMSAVFCNSIIIQLNSSIGIDFKYGLWLADKDAVEEIYLPDDDESSTIDNYEVEACNICICDLGREGGLYLFRDVPKPVRSIIWTKNRWIKHTCKKFPNAKKDIITFIANILYHSEQIPQNIDVICNLFGNGYCYYFALMLKDAFGGEIRWHKNYGHIVWQDENEICYDIGGVFTDYGNGEIVPLDELGDDLKDFKHLPNTRKAD